MWGYNTTTAFGDANDPYQGALVFDGVQVNGSIGADWTYTPLVYWIKNSNYYFSAVNDDAGLLTSTPNGNTYGAFAFNQATAAGDKDPIWATSYKTATEVGDLLTASPGKVNLTFNHALCRVQYEFSFVDDNPDYGITVQDIELSGTPAEGTFNLAAQDRTNPAVTEGSWTATNGDYTAAYGALNPVFTNATLTGFRYLVPLGLANDNTTQALSAAFKVTLYQRSNGNYVKQADYNHTGALAHAINAKLLQGHSYKIKVVLKAKSDDPDNPGSIDPEQGLFPIEFNVVDVTGYADSGDLAW